MQQFKCNAGKTWLIDVTVGTVSDCRKFLDCDLVEPSGKVFQQIESDAVLAANVLFVVCKSQADAAGITDEQFGRNLGGDALEAGTAALVEALINFFPSHRRAAIREAMANLKRMEAQAAATIQTKIADPKIAEAVAAKVDRLIDEAINELTQ